MSRPCPPLSQRKLAPSTSNLVFPSPSLWHPPRMGAIFFESATKANPSLAMTYSGSRASDQHYLGNQATLSIPRNTVDSKKIDDLIIVLRASDRVKASVKEKNTDELLDHYQLTQGLYPTNGATEQSQSTAAPTTFAIDDC